MTIQLYHIHSSDAKWVTLQREKLLAELIPSNMRDENLLEIFSSTNSPLKLNDILGDVIGELSTIPFLPDSNRVVVVHGLGDFLVSGQTKPEEKEGKGAKAPRRLSAVEAFAAFVEKDLTATNNAVIFSSIVEAERGQRINESCALYKMFKPPIGEVIKRAQREEDPLFQMSNALLDRKTVPCLQYFRVIYRDDAHGRIFHEILRNVRFLLQAKVLERLENKGTTNIETKYLPEDKRLNLYMQHKFVQKKIRMAATRFQLRELMFAMDHLLTINKALIPSPQDIYAPNVQLLIETFIIGFCEGGLTAPAR